MKKFALLFVLLVLFPVVLAAQATDMEHVVSWVDLNDPSADCFTVYRATHPDSEYLVVAEGVVDTFWVDSNVVSDERYWYKVSATRSYIDSGMSDWVSGRSVDCTNGQFDTDLILTYYPDNPMVMLIVYPPANDCVVSDWEYMVPDIIHIKCVSTVLAAPATAIR